MKKGTTAKKGSMKKKMMTILIPIIAGISIVIFLLTSTMLRKVIVDRTIQMMVTNSITNAKNMNLFLESVLNELNTLQKCMDNSNLIEMQKKRLYMNLYGTSENYPNGFYYADSEGTYYDGSEAEIIRNFDYKQSEWFQEGLQHTKGFEFGQPKKSETDQTAYLTASMSKSINTKQRVVAVDIPLKIIQTYVSSMEFFQQKGYTILINPLDNSVLGQSKDMEESTFQKLYDQMQGNIESSNYSTKLLSAGGSQYYVSVAPISKTGWILTSIVTRKDAITDQMKAVFIPVVIITFICLLLSILVFERVISHYTTRIKYTADYMKKIAQGDYRDQLHISSHDELGDMGTSLTYLVDQQKQLIDRLNGISIQVNDQSTGSETLSSKLSKASQIQCEQMQNMKAVIDQLGNQVEIIANQANQLAKESQDTAIKAEESIQVLDHAATVTSQGEKRMEAALRSMNELEAMLQGLSGSALKVGDGMGEIRNISELMQHISKKSHLLSLNAAIEASRADMASGGFQVVAKEIGNLAKMSSDHVIDIQKITGHMDELVNDMLKKMTNSIELIQTCSDQMNLTEESFQHMDQSMQTTKLEIDVITEKIVNFDKISKEFLSLNTFQKEASEEMLKESNQVVKTSVTVREYSMDCKENAVALLQTVQNIKELTQGFIL